MNELTWLCATAAWRDEWHKHCPAFAAWTFGDTLAQQGVYVITFNDYCAGI